MKKFLLSAFAVSILAGCSADFDSQNALERWNRFHSDSISSIQLKDNQALAVFYRTAALAGEGVNVYVNGDYQASLLDRSYSPVAVCADNSLFSASWVSNRIWGNRTEGERFALTKGEINYIKISQNAQGLVFERVPAEQAQAELSALKGEIRHTLPRVRSDKACEVGTTHTLSASALWGANKFSYNDMLVQGKKELEAFAEAVKKDPKISRIEIGGFTDPEGSDTYNLSLSQRRAETVRQALSLAGVSQEIKAMGYGESRLVVAECQAKHSQNKNARSECNQPNRRVEITTYSK